MDEHKIAQIIENYFPGDVPDDLREAYEEYFEQFTGRSGGSIVTNLKIIRFLSN